MAVRTARFFEEAKIELLNAVAHYNERTPGAGERLLEDVFETADEICGDPERYPAEDDGYRRWRCIVFPYSLRYDVARDGNVDIVAVAHDRRAPGYFSRRTK